MEKKFHQQDGVLRKNGFVAGCAAVAVGERIMTELLWSRKHVAR